MEGVTAPGKLKKSGNVNVFSEISAGVITINVESEKHTNQTEL